VLIHCSVVADDVEEAPRAATIQQQFQQSARIRAFLVKLLMGTTFDVFIDSSGLRSSAPQSTAFVEALWRRREGLPVAVKIPVGRPPTSPYFSDLTTERARTVRTT
jgi:hypothetical protein